MWMDRGQVVREYKQAKNKRMQIGILAELNNCYKEEIVKILVEEGILEKPVKKTKKKEEVTEVAAVKEKKIIIPPSIMVLVESRMSEVEEKIKILEAEYTELADFIKRGGVEVNE